ncbi:MAG: Calx-beta domain-containing protein [Pirellulales bacterium]
MEPPLADLQNTGGTDTKWGVRVVVTQDVAFGCGCGGIAYINSFTWNSDTPVFVFNSGEVGVAEAASHEVGHSLGLAHDGTSSASYYSGHGLGSDTAYWSTIMGVGYYVDVSQWDNGEYYGSNNTGSTANYGRGADDLAIITGFNGFGYKTDDHGNDRLTASALTVSGNTLSGSGLITNRTDSDFFSFTTGAGSVTLNVNPAAVGANLDVEATLYDSAGTVVATSNPLMTLNASITATLAAGQYFLKVDGVGAGNPTTNPPTGYSDYASIGAYTVSGSLVAVSGDSLAIAATDATKNEGNSGSTAYTFTVNRTGTTTGTTTVNYAVAGSGASPASASDFVGGVLPTGTLTFAPGVTSQVITIDVQGDTTVESSETFAVGLTNPSASTTITTGSATGTITNDDSAPTPPSFAISATDASKAEGTSSTPTPFKFTITRSGSLTAASSVRYSVSSSGNSRASSNDLTNGFVSNVLVNFPIGAATADVIVNVAADSRRESNETFRVTLSNAVGATIAVSTASGLIINDDSRAAAPGTSTDDSDDADLIAVADPMWFFMPAEMLTANQLAVPVITWVNGEPFIGDLDEMFLNHDDTSSFAFGTDDSGNGQMSTIVSASPFTGFSFNGSAVQLSTLTSLDSDEAESSALDVVSKDVSAEQARIASTSVGRLTAPERATLRSIRNRSLSESRFAASVDLAIDSMNADDIASTTDDSSAS